MQGMEALAPLVARSAVFLFRDPIEGAKALCTRYGLVNQTLRLQLRVEQLRRFQASWQVLLTRMAAHGLKAPTIYHEEMVANSTRTFLSVASAWNLTTVQLELQANRTHAPLDALRLLSQERDLKRITSTAQAGAIRAFETSAAGFSRWRKAR